MIDLAIIGGGPAGYVAAERAGAKGLKVVLFEGKALGGVCLNEGCMPTKTLLYSAKLYDHARESEKYGITTQGVEFDFGKIVARKNRVVRRLVGGIGVKMKNSNVTVVMGAALIKSKNDKGIQIQSGEEIYWATNLLICTGAEAFIPPIEGLAQAGESVVTSGEILALTEQPKSLVIIGGGVIGMEFASFYNSLGTEVTVVEMLPEILGGVDAQISAMLREVYTKKGVAFHLSCKVTRVEKNRVVFTNPAGETLSAQADKILISVGRKPVTQGFGLENIGVVTQRGAIVVDEAMRTNVGNVFAAGDVTGYSMLAHTASREGEVVVNNILGMGDKMHYNAIPGVVYTTPEVASVGLTAQDAAQQGVKCREVTLAMAFAGRYMVENDAGGGLCKVVVSDDDRKIIGVHMLGNPSSEIIYGACMAIEQGMTIEQLEKVIFPHPTVSEIIKEAAFLF